MPRNRFLSLLFAIGLLLTAAACDRADQEGDALEARNAIPEREPEIIQLEPAAAAERAAAIRQEVTATPAAGLDLTLWASEELLADPIALDMDDQGRAYVTRTFRQDHSEFDIRGHRDWMTPSIGFQTVENRRNFLHQHFAPERSEANAWLADLNGDGSHDWQDLAVEQEHVYRIDDTDGDGAADRSQLYVEDFSTEVTDVAGAVLAYEDDVYVGVAPDLWRLHDADGDGMADAKASLSTGYAVHIGFSGHGMSGLTVGPDGRIYWGIGDIGLNVTGPDGKKWTYPNQGAILRSEPDGSGFEVFAAGVRNTHEFDFDQYGNLISVDNDGDHPGEEERLVYLVEGSDSGWRSNWQYGKYTDPDNNEYKVWMDEEMFKPRFEGQAAYITPPVANYHSGPAGMAYNPGTALSEAWQDHFFVAEFTGTPARSRIHAFKLKPRGATFELEKEEVLVDGILATGLDFGPDGALYFADWIDGWGTKDKGRIWKVDAPEAVGTPLRTETRAFLAEDFGGRAPEDLAGLLQHADMRVRLKAQFALAERGASETLLAAVRDTHQLARLHGLWGIGQLARKDSAAAEPLVAFLQDGDPEIRAQAAKVLGDVRYGAAADALIPLLQDDVPRARFFAAEALGRLAHRPALQPLIAMLEANDDEDAYLRHAGTLALAHLGEADPIVALADSPSRALRIAAVVTLRRLQHPGVARFLNDDDEYIVTEAARAINDDASIEAALPELARVLERDAFTNEALLRRAINANLRLGTAEYARRVAQYAARAGAPEELRVEALAALGVWPKPSPTDRVDGVYRGTTPRDTSVAREAIAGVIEPLLTGGSPALQVAAAETAGRLAYAPATPTLASLVRQARAPEVRIAALQALSRAGYADIDAPVETALADRDQTVRMNALSLVPTLGLPEDRTVALLTSVLGTQSVEEQQSALAALGGLHTPQASAALDSLLDRLEAGEVQPEVQLDLLEAVEADSSAALQTRLAAYQAAKPADDLLAPYREALSGGNPERGRQVFFRHEAAQCVRCHAVGDWGADVGPKLSNIGAVLNHEQLLQALVEPSARIAPGYGAVSLTLQDGKTVRGTLQEETDAYVVVETSEGAPERVAKETIAERQNAPSGMPPMGVILTKREIRDVVAFLATLKGQGMERAG